MFFQVFTIAHRGVASTGQKVNIVGDCPSCLDLVGNYVSMCHEDNGVNENTWMAVKKGTSSTQEVGNTISVTFGNWEKGILTYEQTM